MSGAMRFFFPFLFLSFIILNKQKIISFELLVVQVLNPFEKSKLVSDFFFWNSLCFSHHAIFTPLSEARTCFHLNVLHILSTFTHKQERHQVTDRL